MTLRKIAAWGLQVIAVIAVILGLNLWKAHREKSSGPYVLFLCADADYHRCTSNFIQFESHAACDRAMPSARWGATTALGLHNAVSGDASPVTDVTLLCSPSDVVTHPASRAAASL